MDGVAFSWRQPKDSGGLINFAIMKKSTAKFWILFSSTCIVGFCLAKLDTSRNWNDTGFTTGLILITTSFFGLLMSKIAWLWAIIIGGAIFGFNFVLSENYSSWGAILFAYIGSYSSVLFKKYFLGSTIK
jgi:uncharacterized membrane protein YedE/YeeE